MAAIRKFSKPTSCTKELVCAWAYLLAYRLQLQPNKYARDTIMKKIVFCLYLTLFLITLTASGFQNKPAPPVADPGPLPRLEFPLWIGDAPGALGKEAKDIPTLTPYFAPPAKSTGAAIIICPGGGYFRLAPHEGFHYALWLNEQGITGFVLKYRLTPDGYRHPAMM